MAGGEESTSRQIGDPAPDPSVEPECLAVGTELNGRFRVVRSLGRGGVGQVFEATDIRLGRRVAVKVLRSASGASPELRKRFAREARAVAQIQHEHVVTVFDYGIGPTDEPYLVMEYLDGQDLRSLLQRQGQLAAPRAVRLIHDACLGLAAAHERGVIHRDLKPENLFVVARGRQSELCKVLDFGLAKLRKADASDLQTRTGVPFGTLHYMSPEQARGDADIDERTDIYGAAAVLYEMLSGKRLHAAGSSHALLYKIIHAAPERLEQRCAFLPPGLASIVHGGLAADPAQRPSSMEAFARSLERFMRPAELGSAPVPRSPAAAGAQLETLPERSIADIGGDATGKPGRSRQRTRFLAAGLIGSVALLSLVRQPPAAPMVGAPKQQTMGPSASPQLPAAVFSAPAALAASAPAPATSEARAATGASVRQRARPAPARAAIGATAPLGSASVTDAHLGFDRRNPYAESTVSAP